ncbi:OmpA family protein, partial [bacterium]|nr:OmpA family protein [bacterium]
MKKLNMIFVAGVLMMTSSLYAQSTTDVQGSKDYPLVSRFKGAVIEFYKETKWGNYKLPIDDNGKIDWNKPKELEGKVTRIQYTVSPDNNSEFVLQNYKAAFKKAGFTVLISIANEELGESDRPHTWGDKYYASGGYYNGLNNGKFGMGIGLPIWKNNHAFIAAKINQGGKDIYAVIYAVVDEKYTLITEDIVEVEAVETGMVSVENISKAILSTGHIAVYDILFESGKSEIKQESSTAIKNIAEYMNSHADKKFFIVGHTDNTGNFAAAMVLSENRAKAIMNELVTKYGVKPEQLKGQGIASLAPIESNLTKEGRAKNRRVEI